MIKQNILKLKFSCEAKPRLRYQNECFTTCTACTSHLEGKYHFKVSQVSSICRYAMRRNASTINAN